MVDMDSVMSNLLNHWGTDLMEPSTGPSVTNSFAPPKLSIQSYSGPGILLLTES